MAKHKNTLLIFYVALILYLSVNTGMFSDEFSIQVLLRGKSLAQLVYSGVTYYLETPALVFTHYLPYHFFRYDNNFTVNFFKIPYLIIAFYLVFRFFSLFFGYEKSLWASFLFIFFPTHETTVYWFMGQYLNLSFAFYLYAFYLAHKNKLFLSFFISMFASFASYGSTPLALALFTIFILNKELKKALVIIIPNLVYVLYFIPINIILRLGSPRVIEKITTGIFLKQLILQVVTFIDAMFGPSFWLKVYYSFFELTSLSIIIGVLVLLAISRQADSNNRKVDARLIIGFTVMLVSSFLMFALTGRYPQLAFNLGNRITIYGALVATYFIAVIPGTKKVNNLIIAVMILAVFGISDHWKNWQAHQQKVIRNIARNHALQEYNKQEVIYVSGNLYSRYGPFSHIEFFSEDWVPNAVFKLALNTDIRATTLSKRLKYKDGLLRDKKYHGAVAINDYLYIYDSETDTFFKLKPQEINSYIDSLPSEIRHWTQLLDAQFYKKIIIKLMPRLNYAF